MRPLMTRWTPLLLLLLLAAPAIQAADMFGDYSVFSLSPYAGATFWSNDIGLENDAIFGGRAAVIFLPWIGVEGTYGYSQTQKTGDATMEARVHHVGGDLFLNLMPRARVNPYVSGGWAQLTTKSDWFPKGEARFNGWEAAAGLKIRLGGDDVNRRDLRLEARDVMSDLVTTMPNDGSWTHNLIVTAGFSFSFGRSSKDTDGDGVRDRDDACPDTPQGATVDASGCPSDSDGDGVFDGIDQCPDTPKGATVDASGCPSDSDGDGVLDGIDQCPDTPKGATVDENGCPHDSDGDGVYDGIDQCPDTPSQFKVDDTGCPIEMTQYETELLDTGMIRSTDITFKTGSAEIDPGDTHAIDQIGETLVHWPELRIEIDGHTDSTGSEAFNQKLSEQRAQSVLDYLVRKFPEIHAEQYTVKGFGESMPVADNSTAAGRAQNRRVEFRVLNTETIKRVIENQKLMER